MFGRLHAGLKVDEPIEDITITFKDLLVRITALDLHSHVKLLLLSRHGSRRNVNPLLHQRWEVPSRIGPRSSAVCMGYKPTDLYTILTSGNQRWGHRQKLCLVSSGAKPPVAAFEVEEHPNKGTLALIAEVASSITTGVMGVASSMGPMSIASGVASGVYVYLVMAAGAAQQGGI